MMNMVLMQNPIKKIKHSYMKPTSVHVIDNVHSNIVTTYLNTISTNFYK